MELIAAEPKGWSYCVEIFVFMTVRWRICNQNPEMIKKFQTTLMINVLKRKDKNITTNIISNHYYLN